MAKIVESFIGERTSLTEHPFKDWMDGQAWSLASGEDYTCTDASMERQLRRAASRHGKRLAVRFTLTGMTIQAW